MINALALRGVSVEKKEAKMNWQSMIREGTAGNCSTARDHCD